MSANVNENHRCQSRRDQEAASFCRLWDPWCGPCRMQGPIIEEVAAASAPRPPWPRSTSTRIPHRPPSYGIRSIATCCPSGWPARPAVRRPAAEGAAPRRHRAQRALNGGRCNTLQAPGIRFVGPTARPWRWNKLENPLCRELCRERWESSREGGKREWTIKEVVGPLRLLVVGIVRKAPDTSSTRHAVLHSGYSVRQNLVMGQLLGECECSA